MTDCDIAIPDVPAFRLKNARVPAIFLADGVPPEADRDGDGCALVDLAISGGRIMRVAAASPHASPGDSPGDVELGGRQVWPTLVDMHTHLDKGHTVARTPNPDGSFASAREAIAADRTGFWDEADLRRRMAFGLACAEAHGVGAIRTHLDSHDDGPHRDQAATSWSVFRDLRDAWAGRVVLQGVCLVPLDVYATDHARRLADIVAASGGLIGGVTLTDGALPGDTATLLDRLFTLAAERDLDVDLHVDETSDPAAAALDAVARATLRHGYEGRVTCGHCCSLAVQPPDQAARTIGLVAQAGITIVSLPTVNMYLQDRTSGRTPRWRGVTPVHELIAAGVPVAVAGDNCRDAFHAYGDHDMVDTLRQAVRILHFDHPLDLAPGLAGPIPAAAMRLTDVGTIRLNAPADLIILGCGTLNQVVTRNHADRIVLKGGRRLMARPPRYAELDAEPQA